MAGVLPVFAHHLLARMGWPVQRYARTPLPAGPRADRAGGWAFFLGCVAVGYAATVRPDTSCRHAPGMGWRGTY